MKRLLRWTLIAVAGVALTACCAPWGYGHGHYHERGGWHRGH